MGPIETQLTLWDVPDNSNTPDSKPNALDSAHIWKLAVAQYDQKRYREGWRPWHKKGDQSNDH